MVDDVEVPDRIVSYRLADGETRHVEAPTLLLRRLERAGK